MGNQAPLGKLTDASQREFPTSLYIHIPFCSRRCYYCDFTVSVAEKSIDSYLNDLGQELHMTVNESRHPLRTLFIGGGTPTLLNRAQMEHLFSVIQRNYAWSKMTEITVEANPDTVDAEKLFILRSFGVNRISFGVQTLNDRLLQSLGRTHDERAVVRAIELARRAGFERLNVDLMFGLPDQTLKDVRDSLDKVIQMGANHVSAYWLKVEPGTAFDVWQKRGKLRLPGEDLEADMYDLVRETLAGHGFLHYEVSNFALPGEEAVHNLVYWRNEPYLAAGVGAHGYQFGVRYENVKDLRSYRQLLEKQERPLVMEHAVSFREASEDTMMLGLRLRQGVSRQRFLARHGVGMEQVFGGTIESLQAKGLVHWQGDWLCLTDKAWPVANLVFEEFVSTQSAD